MEITQEIMRTYPARDVGLLYEEFLKFVETWDVEPPQEVPSFVCLFFAGQLKDCFAALGGFGK